MSDIKKEIVVGKESSEVFEAVAELIKAGKKGGVSEMAKQLDDVMKAIEGCGQIPDEVKQKSIYMTAGYGAGLIAEALIV